MQSRGHEQDTCDVNGCESRSREFRVMGKAGHLTVCHRCMDELVGYYGWKLADIVESAPGQQSQAT